MLILLLATQFAVQAQDDEFQTSLIGSEFRLEFPPVEGAKYYEIEWFASDVSGESHPRPGRAERFDAPPFSTRIASDQKYFRVRGVGAYNMPGAWSAILPVPVFVAGHKKSEIFRQVQRADGETERYFTGDSLQLVARDDSGEATIYYSIDDAPFRKYTGRLTFEKDGPYLLRYYSIDAAGNREKLRQARFLVDRHPPKSSLSFTTTLVERNGQIFTGPRNNIVLQAADEGSGVTKIRYRIFRSGDARPAFRDYTGPISLQTEVLSGEAETFAVEFYATDRLGNKENVRTLYIQQSDFAVVGDA